MITTKKTGEFFYRKKTFGKRRKKFFVEKTSKSQIGEYEVLDRKRNQEVMKFWIENENWVE